jgi:hypothetical protein
LEKIRTFLEDVGQFLFQQESLFQLSFAKRLSTLLKMQFRRLKLSESLFPGAASDSLTAY